jgi:hypothetical protein
MTRTEVDGKSIMRGPSRRRALLRRLLVLPVALLLMAAPVAPALAASSNSEGLSGYNHKTTPNKEVKPEKKKEAPKEEPAPTTTVAPVKASSLPFTGFDLRWSVGFGLLMVGAGGSIVLMQRRQRRGNSR